MIAYVSSATKEVDLVVAVGLVGVYLWHRGRLTRIARQTARLVGAVAAVVLASRVSPTAVVIVLGVILGYVLSRHKRRSRARRHARMTRMVWKRLNRRGGMGGNPAYEQWMASAGWRRQKLGALNRAHHRCEVRGCGSRMMLEVHHNNNDVYNHLPHARPSDLTVLCHQDHARVSYLHQHCTDPTTGQRYTIAKATRMIMNEQAYAA